MSLKGRRRDEKLDIDKSPIWLRRREKLALDDDDDDVDRLSWLAFDALSRLSLLSTSSPNHRREEEEEMLGKRPGRSTARSTIMFCPTRFTPDRRLAPFPSSFSVVVVIDSMKRGFNEQRRISFDGHLWVRSADDKPDRALGDQPWG